MRRRDPFARHPATLRHRPGRPAGERSGSRSEADLPVGEELLDHPIMSILLDVREGSQVSTLGLRHTNCCVRYSSGLAGAGRTT